MSRRDLVVWTGPVANFQVKGATVPGAKELFIQCRGDKGPHLHCPTIGAGIAGSPSALLAKAGMTEAGLADLFFGAFSAGGSIIKRLMANPEYRRVTTSVHLADAIWTASWADKPNRVPPADEGFVAFAADVAEGPGDKLLVATVSPNQNFQWATGIENLRALKKAIEERTGRRFGVRPGFFGISPGPAVVYQMGNVLLAEFPSKPLGHAHTQIAGQVWNKIIVPWVKKGKGELDAKGGLVPPPVTPGDPPSDPPRSSGAPFPWATLVLSGVLGAAAGCALARGIRG